jgi:hypothetical protein
MLSFLSFAVLDEGCPKEAESLAREACALVDGFKLHGVPQAGLAAIALGRVLANRGDLAEAQAELEIGLSAVRRLPAMSPWPTLVGCTIKSHVKSIYRKLGVSSRKEAVEQAYTKKLI